MRQGRAPLLGPWAWPGRRGQLGTRGLAGCVCVCVVGGEAGRAGQWSQLRLRGAGQEVAASIASIGVAAGL